MDKGMDKYVDFNRTDDYRAAVTCDLAIDKIQERYGHLGILILPTEAVKEIARLRQRAEDLRTGKVHVLLAKR